MGYKQASRLLPPQLLEEIQQYVDGEYLYIPRRPEHRRQWGECSGAKTYTADRNRRIYSAYLSGTSVGELAERYYLSPKTIYKIVANLKRGGEAEPE